MSLTGKGPYGNIEMGGMFTTVKVRDDLKAGDFADPGWYHAPAGTIAARSCNLFSASLAPLPFAAGT